MNLPTPPQDSDIPILTDVLDEDESGTDTSAAAAADAAAATKERDEARAALVASQETARKAVEARADLELDALHRKQRLILLDQVTLNNVTKRPNRNGHRSVR